MKTPHWQKKKGFRHQGGRPSSRSATEMPVAVRFLPHNAATAAAIAELGYESLPAHHLLLGRLQQAAPLALRAFLDVRVQAIMGDTIWVVEPDVYVGFQPEFTRGRPISEQLDLYQAHLHLKPLPERKRSPYKGTVTALCRPNEGTGMKRARVELYFEHEQAEFDERYVITWPDEVVAFRRPRKQLSASWEPWTPPPARLAPPQKEPFDFGPVALGTEDVRGEVGT